MPSASAMPSTAVGSRPGLDMSSAPSRTRPRTSCAGGPLDRPRLVALRRERRGHGVAQRLERSVRSEPAVRARLHEHVAERGRLDRAGEHRQPGAVGGALAEQRVQRAAADDVDRRRRRARRGGRRCARRSANACGEALDDASARTPRACAGTATPCSRAPLRDAARACRRGRGSAGRSRRRAATGSSTAAAASASSAGRSIALAGLALPRAHRFAQQPQAHDVVQEPHPSVDAALVREVRRARASVVTRVLELDADEAPRAARDVGGVRRAASARRRPPRRCRASRPR